VVSCPQQAYAKEQRGLLILIEGGQFEKNCDDLQKLA
jgi:hypothetical protein